MSKLEDSMWQYLSFVRKDEWWIREYKFHRWRKWRFDFALLDLKIAIEIEGLNPKGKSRHTTVTGFRNDCEKYNHAAIDGWTVIRGDQQMMNNGLLAEFIDMAVEARKE